MAKLALRHCTPIKKGTKPISSVIARSLIKQLSPGWSFNGDAMGLEQEFHFKNFHETMGFANAVAWIANSEDHHPDFEIGYNRCKIKLTTHAAGGLTVNDFICAAKIDALYKSSPEGTTGATAEKTMAMPELPGTGAVPIPRPVPKAPELNMSEAEELLNIEIKAPAPQATTVNEEDELKLTNPDDEPTLPHLHNPPKAPVPVMEARPAEEEQQEPASTPEPATTTTDQHEESANHLLTTVILPPGMHTIQGDRDEEATVIAQPDFGPDFGDENIELSAPPDDEDEVRTMVVQGVPNEDNRDTEENENPDLLKTMIIRPPLLDNEEMLNSDSDGDETLLLNPKSSGKNKPR